MFSLSTLYLKTVDWSLTTRMQQWERNVVLCWVGVCGEGRNTSSPKNACVGGYGAPGRPVACQIESTPCITILPAMQDILYLQHNHKHPMIRRRHSNWMVSDSDEVYYSYSKSCILLCRWLCELSFLTDWFYKRFLDQWKQVNVWW